MNIKFNFLIGLLLVLLIAACESNDDHTSDHGMHGHDDHSEEEVIKGKHGGRLLVDGDFVLELAIFETGVPPEFRVWVMNDGESIPPEDVKLNIKLARLGGVVDDINFTPQGDALRGDMEIYEPHSFVVNIEATFKGKVHSWKYDNFEGRTKIEDTVAKALQIKTSMAGSEVIHESVEVYGRVVPNAEKLSHLTGRYPGVVKTVFVSMGDKVTKGQRLASIESNESLNTYHIKSPVNGVVTQRHANPSEVIGNEPLLTVLDNSNVWVELSIFPADTRRVRVGNEVEIFMANTEQSAIGKIQSINYMAERNQSVTARVLLDNSEGSYVPGHFVNARIKVAEHPVSLAVKRSGLQAFRDFTVVYEKIGEEYEVRMLELGRQDHQWAEVLGGLNKDANYVSENSFILKADIEKSGAAHDH